VKTKTDIMDLIRMICDFYEAYRETLGLSHEDARAKVEQTYDDLHEWLYRDLSEIGRLSTNKSVSLNKGIKDEGTD